jgi:nucleotide-binding universal stress UspA family protein
MFNSILLPLDRSALAECALPHAVAVARALRAQITLLHVMPSPASIDNLDPVDPLEWRVQRAEAETYLRDVQTRLEAAGVSVDSQIVDGQAAEQIVNFARERQIGLTIMSSHGRSGLSGWNVSSIVQKVLLRIYASMMVVRAYQPVHPELTGLKYRRLLAPLDGSQRAEIVLPLLADLARAHESQVLLVHVAPRPELPRRVPLTAEETELVEQIVERNRTEGVRYLDEIRGRLSDVDVEPRLLIADTVKGALHQLAEQENADLVILSAHGYTGEGNWPYGAVVVTFVAYGSAPLLIVQDIGWDRAQPTQAELALRQTGRR